MLITLLDDSKEVEKLIEKEDIYMEYREKAKEASKSDVLDLDFSWASIEADEIQRIEDLEEAKAEGIEQNKIETAKKLYKSNVSMDIIEKVTGFTTQQIRNICL